MRSFEDLKTLVTRFTSLCDVISEQALNERLALLLEKQTLPEVYSDTAVAKKIGSQIREINDVLQNYKEARGFVELYNEGAKTEDGAILELLLDEEKQVTLAIEKLELFSLFTGDFDKNDCMIEIHSGAGGEDAQDWAEMLAGMYLKYCETHGFDASILEATDGDGAGIKSETIKVSGAMAYGKLKFETGVHRLVRISPFDSNSRRHTSFASVLVTPIIENTDEITVSSEDLKIDTYRSSGAGGQHVNKTESAVRITHKPTGIVVACQNERSQIQNRQQAMQMLFSKLAQLKQTEIDAEKDKTRKNQKKIEWGSQIRSYVFAPYTQVKDLRTNYVDTNVNKVMAGEIDEFITSELKMLK